MPIDYSKWDKLEVSDDSDVEVHPNVDKKSFIRMKQRQIHDERIKRDQDIKILTTQNNMYVHLNKRVDSMLKEMNDAELLSESKRNKYLEARFDATEKSNEEGLEDGPTYNEMIEDLYTQIFSDNKVTDGTHLRQLVLEHRKKIDDVSARNNEKLATLLEEKKNHITSDDIHTGFDSFYSNKDQVKKQSDAEKKNTVTKKQTVTQIETLNSPTIEQQKKTEREELEDLETYPETDAFGKIHMKDYTDSAKFLRSNPFIVSVQQKDALMMKAFDYQLKDDGKTAKNIVHQALMIQYISDLAKDSKSIEKIESAIGMFFGKMLQDNSLLMKELENTYNHIKNRCEILKKDNAGIADDQAQEEQIQLKSMDPNSQLTVSIPNPDTEADKYEEFLKLPVAMQDAVKTKSLDEINKVFASLKIEESESILDIFEKSGVIGVQAVLENEEEWDKLKDNQQPSIELRSTDPSAELVILKPDESKPEQYAEFLKLPEEMQKAVLSESLDAVNKVFADHISSEDAESVLQCLEGAGVLALLRKQHNLEDEID
ncbi:Cdc37 protein [Saccharomycopsis crataegensis]|uniref:Hsp90 chaperone protein kinase-targeting subunit n=1 Tax=Saccharomycopsis crataegensis TaxID=43959 RepID=A0AAV5QVH9_9ASCO|nr:Cdc37 protein [Saccharomycopsis crataegensis]